MIFFQIIIAFVVLSILILVHEFGHFLAAKLSGIWVEEFGLGYPPRIRAKRIGKTDYSINALPIGGFVKLHGETTGEEVSVPSESFVNKPPLVRIFVAVAGVFMNLVLAVFSFSVIFWFVGVITEEIRIVEIAPNSPAEEAKIKPDDLVKEIAGEKPQNMADFMTVVNSNLGKEIELVLDRGGKEISILITPREDPPEDQGALGVVVEPTNIKQFFPPLWKRPFVYTYLGFQRTINMTKAVGYGLIGVLSKSLSGEVPKGVAGPLGIGGIIAEFSKQGILPLIELTGIISINLALLNILPFPPLDGSRVVFVILESVIGKGNVAKIEEKSYTVGMAILLILVVLITISEIPKIIAAGSLSAFVETLLP